MRRGLVLLVLVGLLVSGCQSQPLSQAAKVGDMTLSHEQVDAAVAEIEADVTEVSGNPLPTGAWGDLRQYIVQSTVFIEVARRYTEEQGRTPPKVDYENAAAQIGLPADNPYVRLSAQAEAYRSMLLSNAQPATPTEADLTDGYQRFVAAVGEQAAPYEEVRPQLEALAEFRTGLGLRAELDAAAQRYGVEVSPRYEPVEAPLTVVSTGQSQLVLVALPLGKPATDAVRDLG